MIGWILFGPFIGMAAKLLMPGPDPGSAIVTILLGTAGGIFGGFIGQALGWYQGDPAGFIMAMVGAMLILLAYRLLLKPSTI